MDAPNEEMVEEKQERGIVSEVVSGASKVVTSGISMIMPKREYRYDLLVPEFLDCLGICAEEKKEGYVTISSEQAKEFKNGLIEIAERLEMSISRYNLLEWAFLVHDWNRIHIFEDYAKEAGYRTTLVHGTLIAAGYEQYARGVCSLISKATGKNLVYAGQTIKFSEPSYTRRFKKSKVNWLLENVVKKEQGVDLSVVGINLEKLRAITCPFTKLRESLESLSSDYITPFTVPSNVIERSNIEIKKGERNSAYRCLRKKPEEEVLMMHPAAFIISTVLNLSSRRTGSPEGEYRRMDLNFHNQPELGIFETMVRIPSPPKKLDGEKGTIYRYIFEALCIQNDKPVVSGKVTCYSPYEIRLD